MTTHVAECMPNFFVVVLIIFHYLADVRCDGAGRCLVELLLLLLLLLFAVVVVVFVVVVVVVVVAVVEVVVFAFVFATVVSCLSCSISALVVSRRCLEKLSFRSNQQQVYPPL